MSKTIIKLVCLAMCIVMILPFGVSSMTLSEAQAAEEELQTKISAIESQLSILGDTIDEQVEYQALLQEKIDALEESIDQSTTSINELSESITVLEEKIQETAEFYSETFEMLKERIKALYLYGDASTLEFLLDASSLYELSLRAVAMEAIAEYDSQLLAQLDEYIDITQEDRDTLTAEKEYLAELKKQQELDMIDLEDSIAENVELIAALQSSEVELDSLLTTYNQEDEELNAYIEELIQAEEEAQNEDNSNNNSSNDSSSDSSSSDSSSSGSSSDSSSSTGSNADFAAIWPVPGYTTISQLYGNGHYGLDIAAPYGVAVVAVNSGKVLSAEYHWSWGYNVLIYHNSTYTTRYAHLSTMAVSAGDYVSTGQIIGYIGSTGNSTGNHLHFEVYKNGTRVNPYSYLF